MNNCKECAWLGTDLTAGLVNACFNEEVSEEEHDRVRNNSGDDCEGFTNKLETY